MDMVVRLLLPIKQDNFYWLPVDPTWNMINPTNVIKANDYESVLGNFALRLRKIHYEDGEIVVLLK